MLDTHSILRLYTTVLQNDTIVNQIPAESIRMGIKNMNHVYAADTSSFHNSIGDRQFSNFNDPAFRCAYLFKYAPLHTYIVLDVMLRILREDQTLFQEFLKLGHFKFCCLGGGPGSDAIGVLAALHAAFSSFKSTVTIIDSMERWEATFSSIIRELRFGQYGTCWYDLQENFQWSYIGADLLRNMTNEVNKSISSASFITMVKFISAATCKNTESMVEKIFRVMKPGALVLFIDNAAGGFTQLIERAAKKSHFETIVGPFRHLEYSNEDLKVGRFGYTSCCKTTVTVILLQKPFKHQQNRNCSPVKKPLVQQQNGNCSPVKPSCSNQNTAIVKKPVVPVQNINQPSSRKCVPAQGNVDRSLLPSNINIRFGTADIHKPSESSVGSRAQRNSSYKPVGNENSAKSNRPAQFHSSSQCKLPIKKDNLNRKSQKPQAPNAYEQKVRRISQVSSNSVAEDHSDSTRLLPYEQNTYPETRTDTVDTCCSCCVIS